MKIIFIIFLIYAFLKTWYYGLHEKKNNKNKTAAIVIFSMAIVRFHLPYSNTSFLFLNFFIKLGIIIIAIQTTKSTIATIINLWAISLNKSDINDCTVFSSNLIIVTALDNNTDKPNTNNPEEIAPLAKHLIPKSISLQLINTVINIITAKNTIKPLQICPYHIYIRWYRINILLISLYDISIILYIFYSKFLWNINYKRI